MKTIETIIQTEPVIYAQNCPLHQELGYKPKLETTCKNCEFFISPNKHGWTEHKIPIVEESSDHEDDISSYRKVIKCINCDSQVVFYSGYSVLSFGVDDEHCQECGTYYYFRKYKDGLKTAIFLIPLKSTKEGVKIE